MEEEPQKIETNDVETTTRKPKGHRPKKESKDDLLQQVNCEKRDKVISLHNKNIPIKSFVRKKLQKNQNQNQNQNQNKQ